MNCWWNWAPILLTRANLVCLNSPLTSHSYHPNSSVLNNVPTHSLVEPLKWLEHKISLLHINADSTEVMTYLENFLPTIRIWIPGAIYEALKQLGLAKMSGADMYAMPMDIIEKYLPSVIAWKQQQYKSSPCPTTTSSSLSLLSGETPIVITGESVIKRLNPFGFLPFR